MRQITRDAVSAFLERRPFKRGNTEVKKSDINAWEMSLYGSSIAYIFDNDRKRIYLYVDSSGFTKTTQERLNGLPNVDIKVRGGKWFLNNKEWDGAACTVPKSIEHPNIQLLEDKGISKYQLPQAVIKRLEKDEKCSRIT